MILAIYIFSYWTEIKYRASLHPAVLTQNKAFYFFTQLTIRYLQLLRTISQIQSLILISPAEIPLSFLNCDQEFKSCIC